MLFFLINKTNKDKSKNIRNLLISIILRFTFSLCFLILIGILDIESYNLFIMNFFAFYLLYIIFEIRIIERIKITDPKKYTINFFINKNQYLKLKNINFHANFFNSYLTI